MLRLLLSVFLCLSLVGFVDVGAQTETERVLRVEPVVRDGKLYIDADIEFSVSGDLRNAAEKGVPI
jgi:hypothetical protein